MLVMIDNYDSFTYNLVQYFQELGANLQVFRHDQITLEQLADLQPEKIVISPGPCTPDQAGISMQVIDYFKDKLPILGVCLGHQSIGQVFGGQIIHADKVMHGKTSMVHHQQQGVFQNLPNPMQVTRYHSLVIATKSLPDCLTITAWTEYDDGSMEAIMGVKHKEYAIQGVQFHPESILTPQGKALLANFLQLS